VAAMVGAISLVFVCEIVFQDFGGKQLPPEIGSARPPIRPFLTVEVVAVVDRSTTATTSFHRPYGTKKRRA